MKRKIAIIGANEAITMLINKAKDMGYETHVFAWQCGDPGEDAADYFYPISIDKKDKILEKCKQLGIVGVCSITSDFAVPTVNYVARNLGLVGNSEKTDVLARNKYQMRLAFKNAGLYTPEFYEVGADLSRCDFINIRYPVIVKPIDRWSSKGVTRVDYPDDLKAAVAFAASQSFVNKAIVEGFMNGPEYSAECICFNGEKRVVAFTQKQTTDFPHYIETGHIQPSNISEEKQKDIETVIYKALDALDIQNGATHVEFRILDDGDIGIIEIGARMGGDCIGTDLTPISTGMDYIRMVIDISCGKKPCLDIITKPRPVAIKFIIESRDIEKYEEIRRNNPEIIIRTSKIDTNFENQVVDSSTRHGYYIIKM